MLLVALSSLRARKSGFVGAFIALLLTVSVISACGMLLQSGLAHGVATERYAGVPFVIARDQHVSAGRHRNGKSKTKAKPLAEHAWLRESVLDRLRTVTGVRDAIPELTFTAAVVADGHTLDAGSSGSHPRPRMGIGSHHTVLAANGNTTEQRRRSGARRCARSAGPGRRRRQGDPLHPRRHPHATEWRGQPHRATAMPSSTRRPCSSEMRKPGGSLVMPAS